MRRFVAKYVVIGHLHGKGDGCRSIWLVPVFKTFGLGPWSLGPQSLGASVSQASVSRGLNSVRRIPELALAGDPRNGDVSVKMKIPISQRSILSDARLSTIGPVYGKERRDIHQRLGDRTVEQEGSRRSCKYNPASAA